MNTSSHPRHGDVVIDLSGARGIVLQPATEPSTLVTWRRWSDSRTVRTSWTSLTIVRPRRYSPAIDAMIDAWDGGDVWGSAMSMAWAVAEVARAAELESDAEPIDHVELDRVPQILEVSWGMTPALSIEEMASVEENPEDRGDVSFETGVLAAAYQRGDVTDADLLFAARVLDRYLDIARAAGHDY